VEAGTGREAAEAGREAEESSPMQACRNRHTQRSRYSGICRESDSVMQIQAETVIRTEGGRQMKTGRCRQPKAEEGKNRQAEAGRQIQSQADAGTGRVVRTQA
jgi:hypothetical protein